MKKLLFLIFLLAISCQKADEESSEFRGIGEFEIGADFKSLASAGEFTEVLPGEYSAPKFEISDDIGEVSNLYVVTEKGKISQVRFSSNSKTRNNNFSRIKSRLVLPTVPVDNKDIAFYSTRDGSIFFFENKFSGHGKLKPYTEYIYSDTLALQKDFAALKQQIGTK